MKFSPGHMTESWRGYSPQKNLSNGTWSEKRKIKDITADTCENVAI